MIFLILKIKSSMLFTSAVHNKTRQTKFVKNCTIYYNLNKISTIIGDHKTVYKHN